MIKSLVKFLVGLVTTTVIYTYLHYSEAGIPPDTKYITSRLIVMVGIAAIAVWLLGLSSKILTKWINWNKKTALRFVSGIVINVPLLYGLCAGSYEALKYFKPFWTQVFGHLKSDELGIKLQILLFVVVFIHSISDLMIFSYKQFATGQIESVRLTRRQYQLQFEALKSQLSPHYLFNCLNTISSLVYTNPEDAETFIRKLVQTYQYILNTKDEKLVSLSRELEFIRAYNYLLKIRYPEGLGIEIEIPESVQETVLPPLTLQMLIENAVKHNDLSEKRPLRIKVSIDENEMLTVSNSKNERKLKAHSFHIGLQNIRSRYQFFTEKSIEIINEDLFQVTLPLLTNNQQLHEEGLHS